MGDNDRALIFDFDGVIVDTETPGYQAWQEVYETYGVRLPLEKWVLCVGTNHNYFSPYDYLEDQLGRSLDRDEIRARTKRRWLEMVHAADLLPGVLKLLDEADALGVPTAVASSSSWAWVGVELERRSLLSRFRCVRCSDHVRNVKPDPELYLAACEAVDVEPSRAVAIEDSPNGIAAAKAAGLFCLAVPGPITSHLDLSAADKHVDSLANVRLADLLR